MLDYSLNNMRRRLFSIVTVMSLLLCVASVAMWVRSVSNSESFGFCGDSVQLGAAYRDGWVVLSKRVLDICYEDSQHGDDRLAFVLGHEISHLLYDSYLHVELFSALDAIKTQNKQTNKAIGDLKNLQRNSWRRFSMKICCF